MRNLSGWLFAGPATIIVLGLSIFPAVWALILSFQKWDGFSEPKFVGLQNYQKLMSDSDFFDAVVHTGIYTLLFVPMSVLASRLRRSLVVSSSSSTLRWS